MKRTGIIILCCFFVLAHAHGQESLFYTDVFDGVMDQLFEKEEVLHLELNLDVKTFKRQRIKGEYHGAELSLIMGDSTRFMRPVRMKARGTFRRKYCEFPPFWLNIRYADFESEKLAGIRRLKVVTRCKSQKLSESYVLREYLVYKMYELVSPYSFRTRLIRLGIRDSEEKAKEFEDWAFLIEPVEMMSRRMDAREVKDDLLAMRRVNNEVMNLLSMFQFMIGNSDYSVTGRHNLKILGNKTPGSLGLIPVPYDFDFTGIVNAHYSHPREGIPIASTRERYFQGPCRSEEVHMNAVHTLMELKDEFLALINGLSHLDEESRESMTDYLESFYRQALREGFVQRHVEISCLE